MTRLLLVLNVLMLALVTPAQVHICKAGLIESALQARICVDEITAETEVPVAAQAVGIYSATLPTIFALTLAILALFRLVTDQGQPPCLALAVPTPPPRY